MHRKWGMGNRVTHFATAASESEEKRAGGLEDAVENSKAPHSDSDSFASNSSNSAGATVAAHEKGWMMGIPLTKAARRILIVDDETAIADTLALIFQLQRYEVRVAYTAERAVEMIAEWVPELAVLDVMLPEMNGIELALVIKANHPRCHVLLFSGHANTGMLLEEAGRKGYQFEILAKPVQPEVMLERASALLSGPDESIYN
jgi:CheY-like chemotaxis protein